MNLLKLPTYEEQWRLPLLTLGASSPKTDEAHSVDGFESVILYLQPTKRLCQWRTNGCARVCLNTSGRGAMRATQRARARRTFLLRADRTRFIGKAAREIHLAKCRAQRKGKALTVRINGTSDDLALADSIAAGFSSESLAGRVRFYDYSKCPDHRFYGPDFLVSRVHSISEDSRSSEVLDFIARKISVAIVAEGATHEERAETALLSLGIGTGLVPLCVDGTRHDLTFLHEPGSIIVLEPKGKAKKDETGFVRRRRHVAGAMLRGGATMMH